MKRISIGCIISLLALCVTCGLIEIGFRLFESRSLQHVRSDRPRFYYLPEGAPTLQDGEHAHAKPAHTFRIAVVGDSFSFGPDLQYDDVYAKRLERMLNLNKLEEKAEVINYGTPGVSSLDEINLVRRAIGDRADLVVLQITLNDPELQSLKLAPPEVRAQFASFKPSRSSWLYQHWHSLRFVAERLHNQHTVTAYKKFHLDLFDNPTSWERFSGALAHMNRMCADANIRMVAIIFPLFDFPLDQHYPFHPIHHKISHYLSSLAVPHLDLFEAYHDINPARLQTIPGKDSHPNEIAHRIAAETVFRWLFKQKVVPEHFLVHRVYRDREGVRSRHANPERIIAKK